MSRDSRARHRISKAASFPGKTLNLFMATNTSVFNGLTPSAGTSRQPPTACHGVSSAGGFTTGNSPS